MPTKDYLKYYWREEKYLEDEIRPAFVRNHFLTPEQFFAIIRWKFPGLGSIPIRNALLRKNPSLKDAVKQLTGGIANAKTRKEKLRCLLPSQSEKNGIRLAMASAILTVLYPKQFSVYDRNVRKQLKHPTKKDKTYPDITDSPKAVERYIDEYLAQVQEFANTNHCSLRNADRTLWGKSWHEDLQDFVKDENKPIVKKRERDLQHD